MKKIFMFLIIAILLSSCQFINRDYIRVKKLSEKEDILINTIKLMNKKDYYANAIGIYDYNLPNKKIDIWLEVYKDGKLIKSTKNVTFSNFSRNKNEKNTIIIVLNAKGKDINFYLLGMSRFMYNEIELDESLEDNNYGLLSTNKNLVDIKYNNEYILDYFVLNKSGGVSTPELNNQDYLKKLVSENAYVIVTRARLVKL